MKPTEKRCRICHLVKPRTEFASGRKHNGIVYQSSRCKRCDSAYQAERHKRKRAEDPEAARAADKAKRDRRARQPESIGTHRAYQRDWARRKRNIPPERWRVDRPGMSLPGCGDILDAEPFRAWLDTIPRSARDYLASSNKVVRRVLFEGQDTVSIDTVDRCCLIVDANVNDIYQLEDAA